MDIIIDDSHVISLIIEYLQSRGLFLSADAVGKEVGVSYIKMLTHNIML